MKEELEGELLREYARLAVSLINAGLNDMHDAYDALVGDVLQDGMSILATLSALVAFNIRFLELVAEAVDMDPQTILSEMSLATYE